PGGGLIFQGAIRRFIVRAVMQTSRHCPSDFQTASAIKIRLIPFSPQIQSVGWASMPDMPHPIYGTPYPSFPRRRESRPFPCGTVEEKGYLTPTFWIPACAGMTII
ncbi:hypothetical protein, partial [Neisseria oralis]|uniref:hypothetical protein n=1 Tax=Neisseria oralis TaxID=1107316 RepID=UPI0027DF9C47